MNEGMRMAVATKTKPGPKPKAGARFPSGKLRPEARGPAPALMQRAVELIMAQAADPMLEGPIGWLRLHNCLTNGQAAAAVEYAKIVGEWDSHNGLPRRFPACQSYEMGYGRGEAPSTPIKAAARARKRFDEVRGIICGERPSPDSISIISVKEEHRKAILVDHRISQIMSARQTLVDNVVLYQIHPMAQDMKKISDALFRLEKHFNLTGIWKRDRGRN